MNLAPMAVITAAIIYCSSEGKGHWKLGGHDSVFTKRHDAGMSEPEVGPEASPGNNRHGQDSGQTEAEAGPETSQVGRQSGPGSQGASPSLTHAQPCDLLESPQCAGI